MSRSGQLDTTTARGSSGMTADAKDQLLVGAVSAYDKYLGDHDQVCAVLKQGFLQLTMAKMNLPAYTVSELSYKDEFDAVLRAEQDDDHALTMQRVAQGGGDEIYTGDRTPEPSHLRHRNVGATAADAAAKQEHDPREQNESVDPLMWFAPLPPQPLRLAQKHFRTALHALLASAMAARTIQHAGASITTTSRLEPAS